MKTVNVIVLIAGVSASGINIAEAGGHRGHRSMELLGEKLFFDPNLSSPRGQSCASCHSPSTGFSGPDSAVNAAGAVYEGAVHGRFGNRKPPTAAYGGESPVFYWDETEELFVGGMFWDGRATGWTLGDPLAEQAQRPFLNPLEQNNASPSAVVTSVARSDYADLFRSVWGYNSLKLTPGNIPIAYERIARSIAAYETSKAVNPFSSKFDAYLDGKARLTKLEKQGLRLFVGKAQCSACHPVEPSCRGEKPLLTDFTYDNLGIPRNPANPFYSMPPEINPAGPNWVDPALAGFLAQDPNLASRAPENLGKHKVPTLRNVDKRPYPGFVKAYGHNGYFKSLKEIVHFYNTRDVVAANWPPPEVPVNVNTTELGNLGLTDAEEDAVVEFMKTLSDGYRD